MTKDECKDFVVRGASLLQPMAQRPMTLTVCMCVAALSHAMARDGSSGGIIRTVVIEQDSVTYDSVRGTFPTDSLPALVS